MRCDDELAVRIAAHLAAHPVLDAFALRGDAAAELRHAAVAVVVLDEAHGADIDGLPVHAAWSDRAALLLTRRGQHLNRHAGQWALPGGRLDAGETPEAAALRELEEEVGLTLPAAAVLGRLDDFVTRSGFIMTPVVVWAGRGHRLRPDPNEVASIHRIPLLEFLRPGQPILDSIEESDRPVLRLAVGNDHIAAPTAAVLYQFAEVAIHGRATRVAHYEQPLFAWK